MKSVLKGVVLFLLGTGTLLLGWSLKSDKLGTVEIGKKVSDDISVTRVNAAAQAYVNFISDFYTEARLAEKGLDLGVFRRALTGYLNLKEQRKASDTKEIVTIIDFNKPSTEKRLWIVDLKERKMLFNSYVAHGQGSGDNMATNFSNVSESHQSSLGFYITQEPYQGKHGLSLRLQGMDNGYNSNALSRAVVVHGADYVSADFIAKHGRLGRSYGCPALPPELNASIINSIKGGTILFIAGPETSHYTSTFLNEQSAASAFNI